MYADYLVPPTLPRDHPPPVWTSKSDRTTVRRRRYPHLTILFECEMTRNRRATVKPKELT